MRRPAAHAVTSRLDPSLLAMLVRATVVGLAAAASACGGAPEPGAAAATPGSKGGAKPGSAPVDMVTPSMLLPDLVGERGVVAKEDGHRRVLIDRMRIVSREDGSLERARELLPSGNVQSFPLPSRLGGGYVFHGTSSGHTNLWRAPDWLGKLEPLASIPYIVESIVPGFDRLYVRLSSNSQLRAIDARTGDPLPLTPLPPAASYGALVIADGWRGVVDADLRGPLATFDAGATWRPLNLGEKPLSISLVRNSPTVSVSGGVYSIDERGAVTFRSADAKDGGRAEEPYVRPLGPLGRRPLRAALEDGWPDSPTTAVVARGGALARVSLQDGAVVALVEDAYPDKQASCHAARVGPGFGFVCGERDGPTAIYEFVRPLGMRPLVRLAKPRFVAPSGNGALVIRGRCDDEVPPPSDTRSYCVRSADGRLREIRVKGDVGVERVVALADGRVAVLVPPRGGSTGQLTLLSGSSAASAPLKLPETSKSITRDVRRGMWLEGFEEREKGVLGGWVEAGGALVGIKVALDGKVTAGEVREDALGAVLAGRFGFSVGSSRRAAETTDGGMSWKAVELPDRDDRSTSATPSRACGPAGCALGGWLRVGWGKTRAPDDLAAVEAPKTSYASGKGTVSLSLACEAESASTPPLGDRAAKPRAVAPPPPPPPRRASRFATPPPPPPSGRVAVRGATLNLTAWSPFRNTPPPALAGDETGVDNGTTYELLQMRAYAWGKKGADWTRAGRWMMRFDDRFDPAGGVRSSAISASPWADENMVAESMGVGSSGYTAWVTTTDGRGSLLDPSGRAVLVGACRHQQCALYAVADGQPVVPLRDPAGRTPMFPRPSSAIRVGETWFFLAGFGNDSLMLWRVDLGVARQVTTYHRPSQARHASTQPILVRRHAPGAIGLLFTTFPEPGEKTGGYQVMPVNPETGALGEAVSIGRRDFAGKLPARCGKGHDGWVFDVTPDVSTPVDFVNGSATAEGLELRVRLDPGSACVEAMATRLEAPFQRGKGAGPKDSPKKGRVDEAGSVPLAATERSTGRRWAFRCAAKAAK